MVSVYLNAVLFEYTFTMNNEENIIQGGFDNLLIVTDFDRTLTQAFVDGKVTALISTMVREHIFDDDYNEKARKSYEYYRPIELNESLSIEYRSQKMQEWWEYVCEVLIDKKLSKDNIRAAMKKSHSILRSGVVEFLTTLAKHEVPIIILSANGLGSESIQCFLDEHGLNSPNIHLFGNEFIWNSEGVAVDYKKPLVHVFNKTFDLVRNSGIFSQIQHRKNVVAIGDNISDLDMIKNCEYKNLLKIGFLNEDVEKLRPAYQKCFDLVIENDGDFSLVNQLLGRIG